MSKTVKEIFARNLNYYIESRGTTQTELCNKLDIPKMTMSNWVKANTYPRPDKVQLLADHFGIKRSDLTEEKGEENIIRLSSANYNYFPVSISAGTPFNVGATNAEQITIPDAIMGKWAGQSDINVMKIDGQSMNKVIPDQSLIAVKTTDLTNLKDNDIVVFSDDNDYSVKRFYNDKENKRFVFSPESTDRRFIDYTIQYDQANNLKIHGKVVVYIVELD